MSDKRQTETSTAERHRGLQILAKTLYRDLISQGYESSDIVNLATQLLSQVTDRMETTAKQSSESLPGHPRCGRAKHRQRDLIQVEPT